MEWIGYFFALFLTASQDVLYGREPIVTDRPDFTESTKVVPAGSTQVESGATWQRIDGETTSFSGPEILIRQSLSQTAELRIGLPNYTTLRSNSGEIEGVDDTYLGFKF